MSTIDTPEGIKWFQMRSQLGALKLEIAGLKHSSGKSVYAHIKRTYGLTGSKQKVYDQFKQMVYQQKDVAQGKCPAPLDDDKSLIYNGKSHGDENVT